MVIGKEIMHIFFLYKKFYKCIRKGCKSTLIVEEIPETKTPKGKEEKEEAEEDPKEGGPSKEDHKEKEDVKEEEKGAIPKKNGEVNPKEEAGKPEPYGCFNCLSEGPYGNGCFNCL